METWERILRVACAAAPSWNWTRVKPPAERPDARGYTHQEGEWTVVVFRFSIEDQGFPKGSVGYDGAVRQKHYIIHCTREYAERLWRIADGKVHGRRA